jgi:hypothetical protein
MEKEAGRGEIEDINNTELNTYCISKKLLEF